MENKKKTIKDQCKALKDLDFMYFEGEDYLDAEINYQFLLIALSDFKPHIPKDRYLEIKHNKKLLVEEFAASILNQDVAMEVKDIEMAKDIIENYFDTKNLVPVGFSYYSFVKKRKLKELSHKALKQIEKGKFKNYIFRKVS